jgi:glycosyltransferase involved in cell wall biosynthesis
MPPITAILHTLNDELRLGRALETLQACDEILIIDHGSSDQTLRIARDFAAKIRTGEHSPAGSLRWARHDWLFCLLPSESVTEGLEASLLEWRFSSDAGVANLTACSVGVREETRDGWARLPASTRLVRKTRARWDGQLPACDDGAFRLEGDLLRFRLP